MSKYPQMPSNSTSRPEADVETNFQTSDSRDVRPGVSGQKVVNDRVVDARSLGHATSAAAANECGQIKSNAPDDLGNGVGTGFAGPVATAGLRRLPLRSTHVASVEDLAEFEGSTDEGEESAYVVGRNHHNEEDALALAKKIDSYTPKMKPEYWAVIEVFVRGAITDAQPDRFTTAQPWLSNVAQLVLWCWKSECLELERETVFAPATIFRFMESRTDLESGSRATVRSTLLRISERLIGPTEGVRDVRRYTNMQGKIPYTKAERISLRSFMRGQGTEYRRRNVRVIIALGAGAGLTPSELMLIHPEHVEDTGDALLVHVPGSRARTVPVFVEWEELLRESLAEAQADLPLVLSSRGKFRYANAIPDFLYGCNGHGTRPHCQRLRSTWIVTLLNAHTPINLVLEAAGVTEISTLGRYLEYLEPVALEAKTDLLRLEVK